MNRSNFLTVIVFGMVLAVAGTGCRKRLGSVTPIPPANQSIADNANAAGPKTLTGPAVPGEGDGVGAKGLDIDKDGNRTLANDRDLYKDMVPDREAFKSQTIYFDFDKSAIKPSETSKLDSVATFLKGEASTKVLVEGNCDERGTPQYNQALGERRALSAREYLVNQGIAADRIFTESFGEDKPAVEGHDEAAWSKNRRDEFVLLHPKK